MNLILGLRYHDYVHDFVHEKIICFLDKKFQLLLKSVVGTWDVQEVQNAVCGHIIGSRVWSHFICLIFLVVCNDF